MAKYQVTHSCGHNQIHNLIGRRGDRDRKLEWLAGTLCSECYRADQDQKRVAASAAAAAQAEKTGLPKLEGTEKQVAWAETIRADFVREASQYARSAAERRDEPELAAEVSTVRAADEQLAAIAAAGVLADHWQEIAPGEHSSRLAGVLVAVREVLGQASAHWWIENRGTLRPAELPAKLKALAERAEVRRAAELRQEELWRRKDAAAAELRSLFPGLGAAGYTLKVGCWGPRRDEKRAYIGDVLAYHHTGNGRHRPRSIETLSDKRRAALAAAGKTEADLIEFLARLCDQWSSVEIEVPALNSEVQS